MRLLFEDYNRHCCRVLKNLQYPQIFYDFPTNLNEESREDFANFFIAKYRVQISFWYPRSLYWRFSRIEQQLAVAAASVEYTFRIICNKVERTCQSNLPKSILKNRTTPSSVLRAFGKFVVQNSTHTSLCLLSVEYQSVFCGRFSVPRINFVNGVVYLLNLLWTSNICHSE